MKNQTVYIIGAGASKEADLPTGYELKGIIRSLLDIRFEWGRDQKSGDYLITNALRDYVKGVDGQNGDISPFLKEAWHIRDALSQAISIDNFIDAHRGNDALALCGKLSIVRSIIQSERNSLLYFTKDRVDSTIDFDRIEKTWYLPFFQIITENCGIGDLKQRLNSISLIIFNYDRCIEHFLFHAFINYYRVTEQESSELVSHINIYHPYGKVGYLPWQNNSKSTEYGAEINPKDLLFIAEGIKTFTEGTNPESSDIIAIREKIENASRLVFMGFAFHKLNMGLLKPTSISRTDLSNIKCYATTVGISESDKEVISEQISGLYDTVISPKMANVTCYNLFGEFWRSLSF
jgi:hypothetical protein